MPTAFSTIVGSLPVGLVGLCGCRDDNATGEESLGPGVIMLREVLGSASWGGGGIRKGDLPLLGERTLGLDGLLNRPGETWVLIATGV